MSLSIAEFIFHLYKCTTDSQDYTGTARWSKTAIIPLATNNHNDNYAKDGIRLARGVSIEDLERTVGVQDIQGSQYNCAHADFFEHSPQDLESFKTGVSARKGEDCCCVVRGWAEVDGKKSNLSTWMYWCKLDSRENMSFFVFAAAEAHREKSKSDPPGWIDIKASGTKTMQSPAGRLTSMKSAGYELPGLGQSGDDVRTDLTEIG